MWSVIVKELLELSRDRRVLLTMILVPLLIMPLVLAIAAGATAWVAKSAQEKPLSFALQGELNGYELVALINQQKGLVRKQISEQEDPEQLVKDKKVDFALVVKGSLPEARWLLYYDGAKVFSRAKRVMQTVRHQLQTQWQSQQLQQQGIEAEQQKLWLHPIELEAVSVADERETVGANLGSFLPYLVLVIALSGAMYPAIDLGAGEKERGTLETLLMSPISVQKLIYGKVAVVSFCAVLAGLLALFSLSFWSSIAAFSLDIEPIQKALQSYDGFDLLLLILLLLPVAAIFGAMMTAVSFYAKSFKEAQNYMGLAYMLPFIPLMIASVPGVELSWGWSMVPLSNVALAIKELTKGTLEWHYLLIIWINSSLVALFLARLSVGWCRQEKILFR